ncbi:MAG: hypothetical protein JSV33_07495 [bacterium]|nr:MAG: hypothetical protein JSV33_07495 [bacterium]
MRRLEKLIRDMRKQLFPYHHEHDIERGGQRWDIDTGEYLSSWIAEQLRHCRNRTRCSRRGRCAFYSYSDLAKRNFEICQEVLLRLENGGIRYSFEEVEGEGEDDK